MTNRVVHHYGVFDVPMVHNVPAGSKIVSAAMRQGEPRVYVEKIIDEAIGAKEVPMMVVFVGTGQRFAAWGLDYIASLNDGDLVWHVYGKIDHWAAS